MAARLSQLIHNACWPSFNNTQIVIICRSDHPYGPREIEHRLRQRRAWDIHRRRYSRPIMSVSINSPLTDSRS